MLVRNLISNYLCILSTHIKLFANIYSKLMRTKVERRGRPKKRRLDTIENDDEGCKFAGVCVGNVEDCDKRR